MKEHFIFLGITFSVPSKHEKLSIDKLNDDSVVVTLDLLETHPIPSLRGIKNQMPINLSEKLPLKTQDEAILEFNKKLKETITNINN